jgi:hypothetical protein
MTNIKKRLSRILRTENIFYTGILIVGGNSLFWLCASFVTDLNTLQALEKVLLASTIIGLFGCALILFAALSKR